MADGITPEQAERLGRIFDRLGQTLTEYNQKMLQSIEELSATLAEMNKEIN